MKKIEAWKTDDDKIWETEAEAETHQNKVEGRGLIITLYYAHMIECPTDLIDFLDEYKITVLKYYGLTEK